jgi:TfoX/Sxy family transcriptional regulator of competence genes
MPDLDSPMANAKWQHAPQELVAIFLEAVKYLPEAETRKMFGYPCAFVNGQMFTGLHQDNMILRLSEADRAAFRALDGAHPFEPMPGRPMREYSVVPDSMLHNLPELDAWLAKSFKYAKSLPPKEKKAARKKGK